MDKGIAFIFSDIFRDFGPCLEAWIQVQMWWISFSRGNSGLKLELGSTFH